MFSRISEGWLCSDLFFHSLESRSYKSLRAQHPFAEWLHRNWAFTLFFTLKTLISNPRTPPTLQNSDKHHITSSSSRLLLSCLVLSTRLPLHFCLPHPPGEAQAAVCGAPAGFSGDTLTSCIVFFIFSTSLHLHLSYLPSLPVSSHSCGFSCDTSGSPEAAAGIAVHSGVAPGTTWWLTPSSGHLPSPCRWNVEGQGGYPNPVRGRMDGEGDVNSWKEWEIIW